MRSVPIAGTPLRSIFRDYDDDDGDTYVHSVEIMIYDLPDEQYSLGRRLGGGDEGNVHVLQSKHHQFAIKIWNKEVNRSLMKEITDGISCCSDLMPKYYFIGFVTVNGYPEGIPVIVMDIYDITLRDYVLEHPETKSQYAEILRSTVTHYFNAGYLPYDFMPRNIMLNFNNPGKLYYVDVAFGKSNDIDEYQEIIREIEE